MKNRTREILHSLFWAALILGTSWLLRGTSFGDNVFIFVVLGWLLSRDLVVNGGAGIRRDWRCIQRHVLRRDVS